MSALLPRFTLALSIVVAVALTARAQPAHRYFPIDDYSAWPTGARADIAAHTKADVEKTKDSPFEKDFRRFYTTRAAHLETLIADSTFYFDAEAYAYHQRIFRTILDANAERFGIRPVLFLSRETVPNAACLGGGFLVYNLALSRVFQNEAQVAFVICHELSHHLLDHVAAGYAQRLQTVKDKDFRREVAAAKKAQYGSAAKLDSLSRAVGYSAGRHSRTHEEEADSLALVLMAATPYALSEAAPALLQLDSSDYERRAGAVRLAEVFTHPEYPFQPGWTAVKVSPFFSGTQSGEAQAAADSLKTHPDCPVRAARVAALIQTMGYRAGAPGPASTGFRALHRLAEFETAENYYRGGDLSNSIYHCLLLLQSEPGDLYPVIRLGAALNDCYAALAAHRLEDVVQRPSPFQAGDYRALTTFLNTLRLSELGAVTFYFLQRHHARLREDAEGLYQYAVACRAAGKEEAFLSAAADLKSLHPESKYIKLLEAKP